MLLCQRLQGLQLPVRPPTGGHSHSHSVSGNSDCRHHSNAQTQHMPRLRRGAEKPSAAPPSARTSYAPTPRPGHAARLHVALCLRHRLEAAPRRQLHLGFPARPPASAVHTCPLPLVRLRLASRDPAQLYHPTQEQARPPTFPGRAWCKRRLRGRASAPTLDATARLPTPPAPARASTAPAGALLHSLAPPVPDVGERLGNVPSLPPLPPIPRQLLVAPQPIAPQQEEKVAY